METQEEIWDKLELELVKAMASTDLSAQAFNMYKSRLEEIRRLRAK